jgi:hypothetical protein
MKKLLSFFTILSATSLFANEIKVTSEIEDVTVFLQGAQVNRGGSVTVPAGQHEIIFTGISPLLKRESLQAGTKSDITILSVHYETKLTEKEQNKDELKVLETKQNELQRKLTRLYAKLEVINSEEMLIQNLANLQSQKTDFTVDEVVKAQQVIAEKLEAIKLRRIDTQELINTINQELNQMSQKISAFGEIYSSVEPRVVVKVKSAKEERIKMRISYFVPNARWFPSYNLRVSDLTGPLVIDYQANISQQTGEDWKDVKLTLSTNDPNLTGQKPILTPWYLVLNQNNLRPNNNNVNRYTPNQYMQVSGRVTDQYGEALPFANIRVIGSTVGTTTDLDGFYQLNLPNGATQLEISYIGYNTVYINVSANVHNIVMAEKYLSLEEVTVVSDMPANYDMSGITVNSSVELSYSGQAMTISDVEDRKTGKYKGNRNVVSGPTYSVPVDVTRIENVVSAEFKINEIYSIPSDEKSYMVSIDNIEKKAFYQYYCAPRLDPDAFLTAQLTDWEDLNLLEGSANIFFEGTFVGSSLLDAKFVGDTLDISLGRDKRIVVERVKEKEFSKTKVLGSEVVKSIKWNISVKNNKDVPINLIVEDQFPLTGDASIKIEKDEVASATVDETTGFITWDVKLAGGKMAELSFKYKVTYPAGNEVYLE